MSSRDKPNFIHPFLFFVVQDGIMETHGYLTSRGASGEREADKGMLYHLIAYEQDLKDQLAPQITWLKEKVQLTPEELNRWNVYSQIYSALHKAHYFDLAKGGPSTRIAGLTDIKQKLGMDQDER
jgi:hypothetical protein